MELFSIRIQRTFQLVSTSHIRSFRNITYLPFSFHILEYFSKHTEDRKAAWNFKFS